MHMLPWSEVLVTILTSLLASSGLWAFLTNQISRKESAANAEKAMLRGLGHDRIMYLGESYIERGYITADEYENLKLYLYEPYEELGGNGSAKRIMAEVDKLPIRNHP